MDKNPTITDAASISREFHGANEKMKRVHDWIPEPDASLTDTGQLMPKQCGQDLVREARLKYWDEVGLIGRLLLIKLLTDKFRSFQGACEILCLSSSNIMDFLLAHVSSKFVVKEWADLREDAREQSVAKVRSCLTSLGESSMSEALDSLVASSPTFPFDIDVSDFNHKQLVLAHRDPDGFPLYADLHRGSKRLNTEDLYQEKAPIADARDIVIFEASEKRRDKFRVRGILLPKGAKVVGPKGTSVVPHGGMYALVYEDDDSSCPQERIVLHSRSPPAFKREIGNIQDDGEFIPFSCIACGSRGESGVGVAFDKGKGKEKALLHPSPSNHHDILHSGGVVRPVSGMMVSRPYRQDNKTEDSSNIKQIPRRTLLPDSGPSKTRHRRILDEEDDAVTPVSDEDTSDVSHDTTVVSSEDSPRYYPRGNLEDSVARKVSGGVKESVKYGPLFEQTLFELEDFEKQWSRDILFQFRLPAGYWVVSPEGEKMIFDDAGDNPEVSYPHTDRGVGGVYTILLPQAGTPHCQAAIPELDDRVELRMMLPKAMTVSLNEEFLPRRTTPGLHEVTSLWSMGERNALDLVNLDGRYHLFEGMNPKQHHKFTLGRRRDDGVLKEVVSECQRAADAEREDEAESEVETLPSLESPLLRPQPTGYIPTAGSEFSSLYV